jgi:hypothetical protein
MDTYFNFTASNPEGNLRFDLINNPYSQVKGTLSYAKKWAKLLLNMNSSVSEIQYMRVGGRKIYTMKRDVE